MTADDRQKTKRPEDRNPHIRDDWDEDFERRTHRFFWAILALNILFFLAITSLEFRAFRIASLTRDAIPAVFVQLDAAEDSSAPASPQLIALALNVARDTYTSGQTDFAKCALCHSLEDASPNYGPNLTCVTNRGIADAEGLPNPDYRFSISLRQEALLKRNWTFLHLRKFITSPRAFAPGTRMPFRGLAGDDPALRNVVQYLYWRCPSDRNLDSLRLVRATDGTCEETAARTYLEKALTEAEASPGTAADASKAVIRSFKDDASLYLLPGPGPYCP